MDTEKDKKPVTVVLPIAVIDAMKVLAVQETRSFNGAIVHALLEYIERTKHEGQK